MSERLKGSVSFEMLVPTGPYRNMRLTFAQEFHLDEHSHEEVAENLARRVRMALAQVSGEREVLRG